MKNIFNILIISIILWSCGSSSKRYTKTYTIKVDYISNYGQCVPSDTLIITSFDEPQLWIDEGVSILITSHYYSPHASNVRSFKILNIQ